MIADDARASNCQIFQGEVRCSGVGLYNSQAPAAAPAAAAAQRGATSSQVRSIGSHVTSAFGGKAGGQTASLQETGISAGEGGYPYAIWTSLGAASMVGMNRDNEFDGMSRNVVLGFDYMPTDRWIVGVAPVFEFVNLNTTFNAGTIKREGYGLTPYAGYNFGQGTTADVMLGATWMTSDIMRGENLTKGTQDGWRWMGAANIHHTVPFGQLSVRGDLGYLYSQEVQLSYYETGTNATQKGISSSLSRGKVGVRASYSLDAVEPYAQVYYLRDFVYKRISGAANSPNRGSVENDPNEVDLGFGLDWSIDDRVSVGAELSFQLVRANEKSTSGLLNGRFRF